jgi:prepilin-type N-terminal cleavage/methylation domain-containing protein/prepilin-type processing-associated H-X9-DG protein
MKQKAFTLIELLVVIGVIAVLIAMLMPALKKARTHAVAVQCQSNLRQIGMAFFNYATDNRDHIVPPGYAFANHNGTLGACFYHILGKAGYLGAMETFQGQQYGMWSTRFRAARCPAEYGSGQPGYKGLTYYDAEAMAGSYSMNYSIVPHYAMYIGFSPPHTAECYRKGFLKGSPFVPAHEARYIIDTPAYAESSVIPIYNSNVDGSLTNAPLVPYAYRHPGQTMNALYMDGHVQAHAHVSKTQTNIYQVLWP